MLYSFLKIVVGFALKIFFKKIFVEGQNHIQPDKAQIIASNHPNGFLEPLIMACFLPEPLHFLVRGDVFKNPVARYFLRATNQIPIYRFRDGFSKLRNNSKTMDESQKVLSLHKNLLIFAEGGTQSIKKLRPLQKGVARIAFQTLEQFPDLDLEILPAGINFTYHEDFNEEVYLKIGKPVKVRPFYQLYLKDKSSGIDALLKEVYSGMKDNIIHLENQHLLSLFENTIPAVRLNSPYSYPPVLIQSDVRLLEEKKWALTLDMISDENLQEFRSSFDNINKKARKAGLKSKDLVKKPGHFAIAVLLILGFVPALVGMAFHIIPILTGLYFKKKVVRQKEFKASVQFAVTVFLTLFQYVGFLLVGIFTGQLLFWVIFPVLSGLWARYYYYLADNTKWMKTTELNEYISNTLNLTKTYMNKS